MRTPAVGGVIAAFIAVGCTQTKAYTPEASPVRVELRGLQANRVSVEVNDLRAEKSDGDSLTAIIREQIEGSLGRTDATPVGTKHRLLIDVVEHRSYFTLGNWNAATRFRARLVAPDGAIAGPWEATGSGRRSNMFGYQTARAVAQDSYNAAMSDLLSALNAVTVATVRAEVGMTTAQTVAPAYFEFQVEKPVAPLAGMPSPKYPPALRSAGVEGQVLVQFVVDTAGEPELSTFKVLRSSHDLFTSAVRDLLPTLRFQPAELGGRKVRQLVQMPFQFSLPM
jgi:TonB family protein